MGGAGTAWDIYMLVVFTLVVIVVVVVVVVVVAVVVGAGVGSAAGVGAAVGGRFISNVDKDLLSAEQLSNTCRGVSRRSICWCFGSSRSGRPRRIEDTCRYCAE